MIYHPQQQLIYGGLKEERIEDILASKGDFLETEEGEDSKLYTMSKSEKTGWTVVGASYVTELMKNNRQAQMLYLLAAAGILIGVILISSFISSEITKPLRRLRDSMSLVEKGDFEQASVEITAENEIGSLSKSFNAMSFVGLWALARKYIEQWFFWIIVDAVCFYLYIVKGIPFKAGLYGLYVIIAVAGYFKWKKMMMKKS